MVRIELENAGTITWGDRVRLAYHWLDARGNPIVWDGERTLVPHLAPGERAAVEAAVRGPMPPGPYRLAFDMVVAHGDLESVPQWPVHRPLPHSCGRVYVGIVPSTPHTPGFPSRLRSGKPLG